MGKPRTLANTVSAGGPLADGGDQRKAICDSCEKKNGVRCDVCGCFLIALQKVAVWNCPLNKW